MVTSSLQVVFLLCVGVGVGVCVCVCVCVVLCDSGRSDRVFILGWENVQRFVCACTMYMYMWVLIPLYGNVHLHEYHYST